jgi:hypothetical protein
MVREWEATMTVAAEGRSEAGRLVSTSAPTAAVIIADTQLRIVHAEGLALDERGFALWVWRLRDGLVDSVEVFQSAPTLNGRPRAGRRASDAAVPAR